MNTHSVVHFEITGSNGPALREFYGKLFGWQFQLMDGMDYGLVAAGAETNAIGGGVGQTPPGAKPYVTFYVEVADLQASLAKATTLGGTVILPPTPIPGHGACAMFTDPEGNVIGLYKGDR